MAPSSHQSRATAVWHLAGRQHGVVTWRQLRDLGYTKDAIRHRLRRGRLHRVRPQVYAVGSPRLARDGLRMAAVLACGEGAFLSHWSSIALWRLDDRVESQFHVTVLRSSALSQSDLVCHRRPSLPDKDRTTQRGIPVTTPLCALFDVASTVPEHRLERLIIEADKMGLVTSAGLRSAAQSRRGRPGVKAIRAIVGADEFRRTDSELERRFLRIARGTSLGLPLTQVEVQGFRVDFLWRELGLIAETDGLRYHRTEAQQRRDRRRDRTLAAAGYVVLHFTHGEVFRDPGKVRGDLEQFAARRRSS